MAKKRKNRDLSADGALERAEGANAAEKETKADTKNLTNCTPTEFLMQTNKIRKSVERWLKVTDLANIRREAPVLIPIPEDAGEEERAEIQKKNKALAAEKAKENISRILDAALETYSKETLEILALAAFVEPKNVDDYPMSFYFKTLSAILSDEDTMAFFGLLGQLAGKSIF